MLAVATGFKMLNETTKQHCLHASPSVHTQAHCLACEPRPDCTLLSVLPLHKPPSPQHRQALLQAPSLLLGQSTGLGTDCCSPTAPASPTTAINPSPRRTMDTHVCLFRLQQQSWAISTETTWPTKPKILFGLYRKLCKSRSRTALSLKCAHTYKTNKKPHTLY